LLAALPDDDAQEYQHQGQEPDSYQCHWHVKRLRSS
jgi:hypothetical protein